MMVDALSVCLPDDPEGNAKLMFSILDCLPKVNRVSITIQTQHIQHQTFKLYYVCVVAYV
jgi:hypothetical protein